MASSMHIQGSYAFLAFELMPARRRLLEGDRASDLPALFASRPAEVLSGEAQPCIATVPGAATASRRE